MRNVVDKSCRENQNTCFMTSTFFPKKSSLLLDSVVQTQNTLLEFHCKHGYVNMPQCYVIRTLSVLYYWSVICTFNWKFLFISCLLACYISSPSHPSTLFMCVGGQIM